MQSWWPLATCYPTRRYLSIDRAVQYLSARPEWRYKSHDRTGRNHWNQDAISHGSASHIRASLTTRKRKSAGFCRIANYLEGASAISLSSTRVVLASEWGYPNLRLSTDSRNSGSRWWLSPFPPPRRKLSRAADVRALPQESSRRLRDG